MLINDYPVYFDETMISIRHRTWRRTYEKVENVNETEDGVTDVELIRTGKTTIAAAFRCTDAWVAVLSGFNSHSSIQVKFYDVETKAYVTKTMRMKALTVTEVPKSELLSYTNGVYDVQFNLLEF